MRVQFCSLLLIGVMVFTSLTVLGNNAAGNQTNLSNTVSTGANFLLTNNFNMEYCTVDLDNPRSNLNVRTWEGRVVGKLRHGTRVWVSDYSGEWAKVSVKRGRRWVVIGWVDSNYLVC